jgi:creatinine amidohydrolase
LDKELLSLSQDFSAVQFELMLPWQLREAVAKRAVAYVPLGTYEWHCEHLPIGLDALTAHGLCLRAAQQDGGVVLPALHYGTGGGHGDYPWTIMMQTAVEIENQLKFTIQKLKSFGFICVVLFSGHFPSEQLDMIDRLAALWSGEDFTVIALSVSRIEGLSLPPDHAGIFETTLLFAMWPHLVQLDRLPSLQVSPLAAGDVWEEGRHDPSHPIWGVVGPDPRSFDSTQADRLLQTSVNWIIAKVAANEPHHTSAT